MGEFGVEKKDEIGRYATEEWVRVSQVKGMGDQQTTVGEWVN